MPSRRVPATALGEAALVQLALRALDHDQLAMSDAGARGLYGRHVWLQHGHLRHGNAVVDLVAVTENFTSRRLLELRLTVTDNQVFSWDKRRTAWAKHGQVDLTKITPDWPKLLGFVEARNALQHGLGRLTDFQLSANRRGDVLAHLAAAGISVIGDLILVDAETVGTCHRVCENFVITLDTTAPRT